MKRMAYVEDQATVSTWAQDTFGPSGSNLRVAIRANEEMAELLKALAQDDNHSKAAEEVADVFIVLYRLATRLGVDIYDVIDRKMSVNRARKWNLDGTGHGYHAKAEPTAHQPPTSACVCPFGVLLGDCPVHGYLIP